MRIGEKTQKNRRIRVECKGNKFVTATVEDCIVEDLCRWELSD